jgi:hypothetical protein
LKEKQPVGRPSKEILTSRLLWRDISQVTAPSPDKGQLTPLSQSGFRDPASVGGGQQITMISIEVHENIICTIFLASWRGFQRNKECIIWITICKSNKGCKVLFVGDHKSTSTSDV